MVTLAWSSTACVFCMGGCMPECWLSTPCRTVLFYHGEELAAGLSSVMLPGLHLLHVLRSHPCLLCSCPAGSSPTRPARW